MKLLNRLRRRAFLAGLPGVLPALLPALVLGMILTPCLWQLVRGPQDLYDLPPSELKGAYVAANIDTIWDWYADTVAAGADGRDTVTARCYLVPLGDGKTFMGIMVPAGQIAAGDQVLEQTRRWRSDPDAYMWDGSWLPVRGSILPMNARTREVYYHFLQQNYGLTEEDLEHFLPLVLVQGQVNGLSTRVLVLMGGAELLLLGVTCLLLARVWRRAVNLQIIRYCRTRPFPEKAWEDLDALRELTGSTSGLSAEDGWVVCLDGVRSWALEREDVAWVYLSTRCRLRHGSRCRVLVYSRSEPPARCCHQIPAESEEDARNIIDSLRPSLPGTVFGYSPDREQAWRRDPVHFGREKQPAGAAPDIPPLL